MKLIYLVTAVTFDTETFSDSRTWFYELSLRAAVKRLKQYQRLSSISGYKYFVIERVAPGVFKYDAKPLWFSVKTLKLRRLPKQAKNVVGWGIG